MKNTLKLIVASLSLSAAHGLHAQAVFTEVGGQFVYSQNFNTLPVHNDDAGGGGTTGNTRTWVQSGGATWSNNTTLAGWYVGGVSASDGTSRTSAGAAQSTGLYLYSWGQLNSPDRALGTFVFGAGAAAADSHIGLQLQNTTGATIQSIVLTFDVEQWRRGDAVTWGFDYLVTSAAGNQLAASGYTADSGGDAKSVNHGTSGALNGNSANFRTEGQSVVLTNLNWQDGDYLWLRWHNTQVLGEAGIALDNVSISTIPEPQTAAVWIGGGALLLVALRRGGRG